jgi:hypothetical protein
LMVVFERTVAGKRARASAKLDERSGRETSLGRDTFCKRSRRREERRRDETAGDEVKPKKGIESPSFTIRDPSRKA